MYEGLACAFWEERPMTWSEVSGVLRESLKATLELLVKTVQVLTVALGLVRMFCSD